MFRGRIEDKERIGHSRKINGNGSIQVTKGLWRLPRVGAEEVLSSKPAHTSTVKIASLNAMRILVKIHCKQMRRPDL